MKKLSVLLLLLSMMFSLTSYGQKYGEDSLKCIENLSLYKINFRIWKEHDYSEEVIRQVPIVEPWRWVFNNCPMASQNIYLDGVKIYKYLLEKTDDELTKSKLIDTIMLIYDNRIKYFGQTKTSREGNVLARKGVDLYVLDPNRYQEVYQILDKAIALEGNKIIGPALVYYFRTTINSARSGQIDSTIIIENYNKITEIIDYNIKKYQSKASSLANWENIQGNIENSFEPFATCEDLIPLFSRKFEENPDDAELLKKITYMLDKKGCSESELFFTATEKLHQLEPNANSAYLMGIMNIKKENYSQATDYLLEAIEGLDDDEKKANTYYMLGSMYLNIKKYSEGRDFAYKGIELRPDDGNFYILIGDLYAASAKICGDNELSSKAAYWAAVDKYQKAANIDEEIREIAYKRISTYSKLFPSKETIFFHAYKEGNPYKVECWINENTTIRAAK